MGNYTGNLNLYKADPVTDGNDTFNIDTMLNENWDKIDLAAVPIFETTGTASALVVEGLILDKNTNQTSCSNRRQCHIKRQAHIDIRGRKHFIWGRSRLFFIAGL